MNIPAETLTSAELCAGIDEMQHQIRHLHRSQEELAEFIKEDPDPEFLSAYEENKEVIVRKQNKVKRFLTALKDIDPESARAYESSIEASEVVKSDATLAPALTASTGSTTNEVPGMFDTGELHDSRGVYL